MGEHRPEQTFNQIAAKEESELQCVTCCILYERLL